MSGIVLPQQVGVSVESVPGPNAFPLSLMMQQPGAIKFLAVGGISKRLLVAAILAQRDTDLIDPPPEHKMPDNDWERYAFECADRLIAFEEKQSAKVSP